MSLHRVDQTQNGAPVMAAATYASELAARTLPKQRMLDADVSADVDAAVVAPCHSERSEESLSSR
jgi:hypothetical protein